MTKAKTLKRQLQLPRKPTPNDSGMAPIPAARLLSLSLLLLSLFLQQVDSLAVEHVPLSTTTSKASWTETSSAATTAANAVQLKHSLVVPASSSAAATASVSAPPVILLHGLLGSKRNFASIASSLANQLQRPRHIYSVDLRNHGTNKTVEQNSA
jgi:predicted alpha/beta-fold hydrolase